MANVTMDLYQSGSKVTVLLDQRDQMGIDLGNAQLVYTGLRWEEDPVDGGFVKYNSETKKYSTVTPDDTFDENSDNIATSKAIADFVKVNGGKIDTISVNGENVEIDANKNVNITVATKTSELTNDGDGTSNFATEEFVQENGGKINTISINGETQPIDENKNVDIDLSGIKDKIEQVESVAKGANQAVSFGNYSTMITAFNSLDKNVYGVGQNIMIVTVDVPDLWISYIEDTKVNYTYSEDVDFIDSLKYNGFVQVGYYKLSALETQKVNLADYVKFTDYATSTTAGVVIAKTSNGIGYGVGDYAGQILVVPSTISQIDNKTNNRNPITPNVLDHAVKVGITTNTETLTEEEKIRALNWLGAMNKNEISLTLKDNGAYTLTINKE